MFKNMGLILSALIAAAVCALTGGFEKYTWLWLLPVVFLASLLVLAFVFFLVLWLCCAFVDIEKPQEQDSKFHRFMVVHTAQLAHSILRMRMHTQGLEQIPGSGRFLLVCNHINDLDQVTLLAHFKKSQLAFISKRENSSMFIVGKIMHKIQCQRINRENDKEALRTIINCIKIIQEDKASIAVFPEGYTSKDGLLHPFRSGVFKIAQKANVPIVVCTVQNTNKVFRNIQKLKATDVHLHLVKVLQPEELSGKTAVEVGELVHSLMAADLGSDLVLQENT